jgi:murein L,D-transpeptidase YcbB/YkuD
MYSSGLMAFELSKLMWKLVKRDTMSDFGLLMTGILITGQQSSPNLPQQPLVSHDSAVEQVTSTQSIELVQITPPEFIEVGEILANSEFSLRDEVKNIVSNLITKIRFKDSSTVMEASPSVISIMSIEEEPTLSSPLFADGAIPVQYQQVQSPSLPTLQFGNSGVSVRVLQKLLLSSGYGIGVDGFFGAVTETAVKAFQSQNSLVVDGIVGQKTWAELAN